MRAGEVVYRQNGPTSHVYFPVNNVYSQVVGLEDGRRIAAATIGNEGMLGVHVLLRGTLPDDGGFARARQCSPRACPPIPGSRAAERLPQPAPEAVRRLQPPLCAPERRVQYDALSRGARFPLAADDPRPRKTDEFALTHECVAEMLGIRRQTVTLVAQTLREAGFISYHRGLVRILNRRGLENISCECYAAYRTAYDSIVRNGG